MMTWKHLSDGRAQHTDDGCDIRLGLGVDGRLVRHGVCHAILASSAWSYVISQ